MEAVDTTVTVEATTTEAIEATEATEATEAAEIQDVSILSILTIDPTQTMTIIRTVLIR